MADPHNARILLAVGIDAVGIVLATDSAWVADDVDNINSTTDDLGIAHPDDPGVYLWEGVLRQEWTGGSWTGPAESYTAYAGICTRLEGDRLGELLGMSPPTESEDDR